MRNQRRDNDSRTYRSRSVPRIRFRAFTVLPCAWPLSQARGCEFGKLLLGMVELPIEPAFQQRKRTPKCNRETECTELQRDGVTEIQSFRETEGTDVSDVSALASRVATLQAAVEISLKDGFRPDCLFIFARALKAFEITTGTKVEDLEGALAVWWPYAKPLLPVGSEFAEYLWTLTDAFLSVKTPLGANALLQALQAAPSFPYKPTPEQREARLRFVCQYLQNIAGEDAFFISVRDTAKVIQTDNLRLAQSLLRFLTHKGFLIVADKGNPRSRKATRFKIGTP